VTGGAAGSVIAGDRRATGVSRPGLIDHGTGPKRRERLAIAIIVQSGGNTLIQLVTPTAGDEANNSVGKEGMGPRPVGARVCRS
jgi:hypothetical protein